MIALVVFVLIVGCATTLAILQLHATADELRTRIRQITRLSDERYMATTEKFDAVWEAFGAQAEIRTMPQADADDRTKRRAVLKRGKAPRA